VLGCGLIERLWPVSLGLGKMMMIRFVERVINGPQTR